jgi:pimeloyl-ACP methyl ester carboxylesterase
MNEAIESRELITLDGLGVPVKGTYHKPEDGMAGPQSDQVERGRLGVVFFNSLFLPRTATGDSAVYWADSYARLGYPSFRLDLPGLGDSDAPLNTALLDFINAGGYGSIASAKIKELVERFGLSGVVIFGHCAGAVTALFAAAASKECKGLVLMDPYFFLPQQMKQSKMWKRLVRWASRSRFGGALSNVYDWLKDIRLSVRGKSLPGNANFALLRRWEAVATKSLPILLLKAPNRKTPGTEPRLGEFDYIKHALALAGPRSQVAVQLIEGSDHSFANRSGRDAVRQHAERWLKTYFPLIKSEDTAASAWQPVAKKKIAHYENHAQCL